MLSKVNLKKHENLHPCDLCGRHDRLTEAIIEGSMLSVCGNCAGFGKIVAIPKNKEVRDVPRRKIAIERETEIIVANYSKLVKEAREKLGLKHEELAKNIAEKESVIHRLESGLLQPPIDLARKLEQALKIRLVAVYKEAKEKAIDLSDSSLTIGDLLKMKKG